ncbi:unnamed protein product [Amoebophrya sp. A120]|nr:unnamed protein product [Amoebophrya sp. A120]|eukprot:GSA120T00013801001.1
MHTKKSSSVGNNFQRCRLLLTALEAYRMNPNITATILNEIIPLLNKSKSHGGMHLCDLALPYFAGLKKACAGQLPRLPEILEICRKYCKIPFKGYIAYYQNAGPLFPLEQERRSAEQLEEMFLPDDTLFDEFLGYRETFADAVREIVTTSEETLAVVRGSLEKVSAIFQKASQLQVQAETAKLPLVNLPHPSGAGAAVEQLDDLLLELEEHFFFLSCLARNIQGLHMPEVSTTLVNLFKLLLSSNNNANLIKGFLYRSRVLCSTFLRFCSGYVTGLLAEEDDTEVFHQLYLLCIFSLTAHPMEIQWKLMSTSATASSSGKSTNKSTASTGSGLIAKSSSSSSSDRTGNHRDGSSRTQDMNSADKNSIEDNLPDLVASELQSKQLFPPTASSTGGNSVPLSPAEVFFTLIIQRNWSFKSRQDHLGAVCLLKCAQCVEIGPKHMVPAALGGGGASTSSSPQEHQLQQPQLSTSQSGTIIPEILIQWAIEFCERTIFILTTHASTKTFEKQFPNATAVESSQQQEKQNQANTAKVIYDSRTAEVLAQILAILSSYNTSIAEKVLGKHFVTAVGVLAGEIEKFIVLNGKIFMQPNNQQYRASNAINNGDRSAAGAAGANSTRTSRTRSTSDVKASSKTTVRHAQQNKNPHQSSVEKILKHLTCLIRHSLLADKKTFGAASSSKSSTPTNAGVSPIAVNIGGGSSSSTSSLSFFPPARTISDSGNHSNSSGSAGGSSNSQSSKTLVQKYLLPNQMPENAGARLLQNSKLCLQAFNVKSNNQQGPSLADILTNNYNIEHSLHPFMEKLTHDVGTTDSAAILNQAGTTSGNGLRNNSGSSLSRNSRQQNSSSILDREEMEAILLENELYGMDNFPPGSGRVLLEEMMGNAAMHMNNGAMNSDGLLLNSSGPEAAGSFSLQIRISDITALYQFSDSFIDFVTTVAKCPLLFPFVCEFLQALLRQADNQVGVGALAGAGNNISGQPAVAGTSCSSTTSAMSSTAQQINNPTFVFKAVLQTRLATTLLHMCLLQCQLNPEYVTEAQKLVAAGASTNLPQSVELIEQQFVQMFILSSSGAGGQQQNNVNVISQQTQSNQISAIVEKDLQTKVLQLLLNTCPVFTDELSFNEKQRQQILLAGKNLPRRYNSAAYSVHNLQQAEQDLFLGMVAGEEIDELTGVGHFFNDDPRGGLHHQHGNNNLNPHNNEHYRRQLQAMRRNRRYAALDDAEARVILGRRMMQREQRRNHLGGGPQLRGLNLRNNASVNQRAGREHAGNLTAIANAAVALSGGVLESNKYLNILLYDLHKLSQTLWLCGNGNLMRIVQNNNSSSGGAGAAGNMNNMMNNYNIDASGASDRDREHSSLEDFLDMMEVLKRNLNPLLVQSQNKVKFATNLLETLLHLLVRFRMNANTPQALQIRNLIAKQGLTIVLALFNTNLRDFLPKTGPAEQAGTSTGATSKTGSAASSKSSAANSTTNAGGLKSSATSSSAAEREQNAMSVDTDGPNPLDMFHGATSSPDGVHHHSSGLGALTGGQNKSGNGSQAHPMKVCLDFLNELLLNCTGNTGSSVMQNANDNWFLDYLKLPVVGSNPTTGSISGRSETNLLPTSTIPQNEQELVANLEQFALHSFRLAAPVVGPAGGGGGGTATVVGGQHVQNQNSSIDDRTVSQYILHLSTKTAIGSLLLRALFQLLKRNAPVNLLGEIMQVTLLLRDKLGADIFHAMGDQALSGPQTNNADVGSANATSSIAENCKKARETQAQFLRDMCDVSQTQQFAKNAMKKFFGRGGRH